MDPEPQTPFKGEALAIPGKIEVEDFDIPGKGRNEDGTTNDSYSDDSENHGDSDYRKDTGVDLYKKATGIAAGYNTTGDWPLPKVKAPLRFLSTASPLANLRSRVLATMISPKSSRR